MGVFEGPMLPAGAARLIGLLPGRSRRGRFRARREPVAVHCRNQAKPSSQLLIDPAKDFGILLEKEPCVIASLTDAFTSERIPRSALLNQVIGGRQIQQIRLPR